MGPAGLASVDDVVSLEIQRGPVGLLELFSDVVRVGGKGSSAEYGLKFLLPDGRRDELGRWIDTLARERAGGASVTPQQRRVKGTLFVDYVRMARRLKSVDWRKYLTPDDLRYLTEQIRLDGWYPMGAFERLGNGILHEFASGELEQVRVFGRVQAERLGAELPELVTPGNPRQALVGFSAVENRFFDYPALDVAQVAEGSATISVRYGMGAAAEEAASFQAMGFFERLVELCGGQEVNAWLSSHSWKGAPVTAIQLRWKLP